MCLHCWIYKIILVVHSVMTETSFLQFVCFVSSAKSQCNINPCSVCCLMFAISIVAIQNLNKKVFTTFIIYATEYPLLWENTASILPHYSFNTSLIFSFFSSYRIENLSREQTSFIKWLQSTVMLFSEMKCNAVRNDI